MKKILLASVASIALGMGVASAADLPVKAPPMAPPPAPTWTGCYISGGVGYGMWNQDHNLFATGAVNPNLIAPNEQLTATETAGGRGWLGRFGAGCDYQFNQSFLIGVFGDYDWRDLKTHDFANLGGVFDATEKNKAAWAVGGRIGYLPYPNLLTFVSGGWTEARYDAMNLNTAFFPQVTTGLFVDKHTYNGWFIGGGTEYRLPWWQGLTWKTEYRFSEYRHDDLTIWFSDPRLGTVDTGARLHMEKFDQTVTTSLVWRFNFWGGPVVANY